MAGRNTISHVKKAIFFISSLSLSLYG